MALLGVSLLVGTSAAAAPLDDWLAGVAEREVVLLVPRIDRVAAPLEAAASRLLESPALADLGRGLPLLSPWSVDPATHARLGLALDGALVLASGGVAFLPIPKAADGPGYLGSVGLTGVTRHTSGQLVVGPDEATLQRVLASPTSGDPVADCPRKKGEADLFVWWRQAGLGRGCGTVRFDPDRVRADVRFVFEPAQPLDAWIGTPDEGLVATLGGRPQTTLSLAAGPEATAHLARQAPHPLWSLLTGHLVVGASAPGEVTVALRVRDAAKASAAVAALLATQSRVTARPEAGGWRLTVADPEGEPQQAWVGLRGDALVATIAAVAPKRADHRAALGGPGRLDGAMLRGAALAWTLRLGGVPAGGRALADAAGPLARALGVAPERVQRVAEGVAWITAHVAEVGLSVRRDGEALVASLEVVTL